MISYGGVRGKGSQAGRLPWNGRPQMSNDIANRIYNQNFRLDPYVRSLLDTDFYKILMCYFAWKNFPGTRVTFAIKNRNVAKTRLKDVINERNLRDQLDFVKALSFTEPELIWLQGNTFYGQRGIFPGEFIEFLHNLRLPDYELGIGEDGDYSLTFSGVWCEVMLWEIYALSIINEAKSRAGMADMSKYELKVLYANATSKLVGKLKKLKDANVPGISEFGTRRRHGFLWQDFALEAMQAELGDNFAGTSNALHAMRRGLPAIGTNAHELPMVIAALAVMDGPDDIRHKKLRLRASQYDVLELWHNSFNRNLLIGLPDTFGTTQFLREAPVMYPNIKDWRGFREDSKDPYIGAEEKIDFWKGIGIDPRDKLQLFSDGLDADAMVSLTKKFNGRIGLGFGWGTLATNDFRGCNPRVGNDALDPISVVCKVRYVTNAAGETISAVKLSDNYNKATGDADQVALYQETFGFDGMENVPVIV
jgi:nicotinate phosphoribosyltransferase